MTIYNTLATFNPITEDKTSEKIYHQLNQSTKKCRPLKQLCINLNHLYKLILSTFSYPIPLQNYYYNLVISPQYKMSINVCRILTILLVLLFQHVVPQSVEDSSDTQSQPSKCPIYIASLQTNSSQQKSTLLTFYIQQQNSEQLQQQNFIELSLSIKQKDYSLQKAITKANKKVELVKNVSKEYCYQNNGQNCEQIVQADNFKVGPSYQTVKRQPIFNGFIVTYQVKIIVYQTQLIGQLVDNLLRLGIHQIQSIQWKSSAQINSISKVIDAGIAQANYLCKYINRTMGTVLAITQVYNQQQKQENKQSDDEDEQQNVEQEENQNSVNDDLPHFKFQIQCVGKIERKKQDGEKDNKKKKIKK